MVVKGWECEKGFDYKDMRLFWGINILYLNSAGSLYDFVHLSKFLELYT